MHTFFTAQAFFARWGFSPNRVIVGLSMAFLFFAGGAGATVVEIHSLERMSRTADVIVHAEVIDQHVQQEQGRIVTLTTLQVIESLKGAKPGERLTVYQVGGELNGKRMWIAGANHFVRGEEIVFFAMRHHDQIVGYGVGLGKFDVTVDGTSHSRIVEDIGDVVALSHDANGNAKFSTPTPRGAKSLSVFLDTIRKDVKLGQMPRLLRPDPKKKQLRLLNRKHLRRKGN